MKIVTQDRLQTLKEMLKSLNEIPHSQRKSWFYGSNYTDYDWLIQMIEELQRRMQRASNERKL